MLIFSGPIEATTAIQDFLFDSPAALPDDVRASLREFVRLGTSPVDAVCKAAELLFARRDELPPEALTLAASLALFAGLYGFHGLGEDMRGARMAAAMARDAGITFPGQPISTTDNDPIAKPEYLPAVAIAPIIPAIAES